MWDGQHDQNEEIARLQEVAERVARRTNTHFVVDPAKVRNFAAPVVKAEAEIAGERGAPTKDHNEAP